MNCCFGRDLGAVPDATTGCDLIDFPFPSPRGLGGVSTTTPGGIWVAGTHLMSEAFGMASLSSGEALRGPQRSSVALGDELEAPAGGGCIHETRSAACCANQGAADGYCWDP